MPQFEIVSEPDQIVVYALFAYTTSVYLHNFCCKLHIQAELGLVHGLPYYCEFLTFEQLY